MKISQPSQKGIEKTWNWNAFDQTKRGLSFGNQNGIENGVLSFLPSFLFFCSTTAASTILPFSLLCRRQGRWRGPWTRKTKTPIMTFLSLKGWSRKRFGVEGQRWVARRRGGEEEWVGLGRCGEIWEKMSS